MDEVCKNLAKIWTSNFLYVNAYQDNWPAFSIKILVEAILPFHNRKRLY